MRKPDRRYYTRLGAALGVYALLLGISIVLARAAGDAPWRFAVMLLPVPALVGMLWAVAAYVQEADEMLSRETVQAIALSFGAGSVITYSYGLLQLVGAPPLNWMFVWAVYAICWFASSWLVKRRR